MLCAWTPAHSGTGYGIYDARTLAMGGASVASANNSNAQFYNSALLAFNQEIEEKTQDARFLFPLLIPQVSESALDLEQVSRDDPLQEISLAIDDFNAMPDALTAQAVVNASAGLDAALAELDGEDLFSDVYIGMAISEPGKLQGAGFFLGTRLLAGGEFNVSSVDRELLAAYRESLTYIASSGADGVEHPELFDANGELVDPGNDFDSTATAIGVAITEAGVGMSHQTRLFGHSLATGISFKVMRIDTFEDVERVVDDRIDVEQNSETDATVNIDIGLAKSIGKHWRLGFAVKDVIPGDYETSLGTKVRLRPRPRFGAAFHSGYFQLGLDADLTENQTLGTERSTQEVAVGMEWNLSQFFRLRGGYRHDILGNRKGIISAGIGTVWNRIAVDAAYAQGGDSRSMALQFGLVF